MIGHGVVERSGLELIPTGVLSSARPTPFDIYVCEHSSQCVLLCTKNFTLADAKIKELRANKTDVFVKKDEMQPFREYLKGSIDEVVKNHYIDREDKSRMIYSTATMVVDELFKNPESKKAIEDTKLLASAIMDDILTDNHSFISMMDVLTYDYYTYTHCVNVAIYSISIAKKMGLDKKDIGDIAKGAILHDIGKSKVNQEILNKRGLLSNDEFEEMKKHPEYGVGILEKTDEKNQNVLDCVLYHHEKLNGTGYPRGFNKIKIPFFAQIVSVADIFDALTTRRSYKEALHSFEALKLMREKMGIGLNEYAIDALVRSFHS